MNYCIITYCTIPCLSRSVVYVFELFGRIECHHLSSTYHLHCFHYLVARFPLHRSVHHLLGLDQGKKHVLISVLVHRKDIHRHDIACKVARNQSEILYLYVSQGADQ